ncbi:MAG: hypothetical protein HYX89_06070 [Chloroflexi bacterium]|nr:hypothetical protein [Chloroflexota bacterium]
MIERSQRALGLTYGEEAATLVVVVLTGLAVLRLMGSAEQFWFVLLVATTAGVGARRLLLNHGRRDAISASFSIVIASMQPALLVLAMALALRWPLFEDLFVYSSGVGAGGLFLALVLWSQRTEFSADPIAQQRARLALNMFGYLVALLVYTTAMEARSMLMASLALVFVASGLLALEALRSYGQELWQVVASASVVGLILTEVAWAVTKWVASPLVVGAFLLLVFYVATGLLQHSFVGHLSRRVVGEFAIVALLGVSFIFSATFWFPGL